MIGWSPIRGRVPVKKRYAGDKKESNPAHGAPNQVEVEGRRTRRWRHRAPRTRGKVPVEMKIIKGMPATKWDACSKKMRTQK